jgi:dolichyl-phosphate beta-glucosyltransferase
MPHLSVIIPAFNEEKRLPRTLQSVHEYLQTKADTFEIIIVDDGSTDGTVDVVQDFGRHNDGVRLLSYAPNQGKGYAIRTGILAANGDLLLIDDADGSSPIEELKRLEAAIISGADLAIGSRNMPDDETRIKARFHRKHLGNTFNFIVQSLLLPGIQDTQCGFKLFKHEVGQDLFSVSTKNGFAFDVEVLYIAKLRGYKLKEISINWTTVTGSKVNVIVDSIKMLFDVLSIKFGAMTGRYQRIDFKTR